MNVTEGLMALLLQDSCGYLVIFRFGTHFFRNNLLSTKVSNSSLRACNHRDTPD